MKRIEADEGFFFGLGAFETVAVYNRPVFLREHLERLNRALLFLGLSGQVTKDEVYAYLREHPVKYGALKIVVSEKNKLFLPGKNPYTPETYEKGFVLDFAKVRRNETSPFTYHKTLNYGDSIMEKRRASEEGLDEVIFRNSRGEICEGAVTNIFFVKKGRVFTPEISSGLLPGILRKYLVESLEVTERKIMPEELAEFDGCFVTNSLMGIMPVRKLGSYAFENRETPKRLRERYQREVLDNRNS